MSTNSERSMRSSAISLGVFYVIALFPATPLAYAGTFWLGAAERGWRTQVAACALLAGWLALALGAVSIWKFVRTRRQTALLLGVAAGAVSVVTYVVAYTWGGRMLI